MARRSARCSSLYQRLNSFSLSAGTSHHTIKSPVPFFFTAIVVLLPYECYEDRDRRRLHSSAGFARATCPGGRHGGARSRATTVGRGAKPPSESLDHVANELVRRSLAPLADQRLLGGQEVARGAGVQPIGVRPALVHTAPGVAPVVVDLAAEQVT